MKRYANYFGWYGAFATLGAYFLVSFSILGPKDLVYQILNFTGAVGLAIICYYKRTYQPLFVNLVWLTIAFIALVSIIMSIK